MADGGGFGEAAFLGGEEIVNAQRTIAYIENGYGPPGLIINGGCSCAHILELINCPDGVTGYSIPAGVVPSPVPGQPNLDAAPWYDPSVPESADFAGFLPTEIEGGESTYTRERFPRISGGAVLGRLRPQERLITWRGYLFGRTCCAVQYGFRWLTAQLTGIACGCDTEQMEILVCCPEPSSGVTQCIDLPPTQVPLDCDGQPTGKMGKAFRTLNEVGLAEGPTIESQRTTGCKSNCGGGGDNCHPESCIVEVEFTMMAGNPFFHGCPVVICEDQTFTPNPDCVEFVKVEDPTTTTTATFNPSTLNGEQTDVIAVASTAGFPSSGSLVIGGITVTYIGRTGTTFFGAQASPQTNTTVAVGTQVRGDGVCPTDPICTPDFDCLQDPMCPAPELPTIPELEDQCFCEPLETSVVCCSIPDDAFGEFFEGVPTIEIFSGDTAMRNTTIRFFQNPLERPCDEINDPCNECDSMQIRYIPAESTLVLDGTTKTITLKCPGDQVGTAADSLTVSPFSWPALRCINYCVCVETDAFYVSANATVKVSIVPRQM